MSSLCHCRNPSGSEHMLSHSVDYYIFEVEIEQGPVTLLESLTLHEFQSFETVGVVQCCSQKDVAILQTVLITKNPLVQTDVSETLNKEMHNQGTNWAFVVIK